MHGPIPDEFMELMAEKFRVLADVTRLAILRALMEGEKSVGQIVEETGRGQANVSKHLKMMTDAGFLGRRKEGLQVYYRIVDPLVEQLCALVCDTIARNVADELERARKALDQWGARSS